MLLIGFQIRIELLNLESKPECDLKQIIIKVFGSRSWSLSTIRIELLNLESKPQRDLKQIIIKVFGSRSWSVSTIRIELLNLESKPERNSKVLFLFGNRSRARSKDFYNYLHQIGTLAWILNSKVLFLFGNRSRARSKDFYNYLFQIALWFGFQIQKFYSYLETDQERDPKTFIIICFRSRSGMDSKFKSSILLWKPIKSAIQRLL